MRGRPIARWGALASLALALPGCDRPPGDAAAIAASPTPASGAGIYRLHCGTCHQPDGIGIPNICPSLAHSARVQGPTPPLIAIVLLGLKGPEQINGRTYNGIMPAWRDNLSSADIATVLTYLRETWGNSAAGISASEVDKMREQLAARPLFLTPANLPGIHGG